MIRGGGGGRPEEEADVGVDVGRPLVAHQQEGGLLVGVGGAAPLALSAQLLRVLHRQQPVALETGRPGRPNGQSRGQSCGRSRGQSHGQSHGQLHGQLHGQSHAQSHNRSYGQSHGQSYGHPLWQ